jgi:hypothetical protein
VLLGALTASQLVILVVLGIGTIAVLLILAYLWRKRQWHEQVEPIIELEKLVNCKSCGSLIPEGVRLCAFCRKEQDRTRSGE